MNTVNPLKFWMAPIILTLLSVSIIFLPARADELIFDLDTEGNLENKVFIPLVASSSSQGNGVYFISPSGNDSNSGTSESGAWATFARAWQDINPGGTLILMDGVYYQSLNPGISGQAGDPITIKAQHDGKAIIDGQGVRDPVTLRKNNSYFIIEGIVARNGNKVNGRYIFRIESDYNIIRRVSVYDADTDTNSRGIGFSHGNHNLLEDCVAGGTARKLINNFGGNYNTIRRCFTYWTGWDGRNFCTSWPNAQSIQIYHGEYNIIENSIAIGPVPNYHISIQANDPGATLIGNQVLGSIAIGAGMNPDGSLKFWGPNQVDPTSRPTPTDCAQDKLWSSQKSSQRAGFDIHGSGVVKDNLFKDIFASGNAGLGMAAGGLWGDYANNRIDHATFKSNGIDYPDQFGGIGIDAIQGELSDKFESVENSFIENIYTGSGNTTTMNGEGARLTHRYVDGELTNEPLWPWPMESRIQAELGFSVTELITNIIFDQ